MPRLGGRSNGAHLRDSSPVLCTVTGSPYRELR
jgi:hypothetical protein